MVAMLWLTYSTVRPSCLAAWRILVRHFFWNFMSPTAKTSSIIIISLSKWAATLKASLTYMPLE